MLKTFPLRSIAAGLLALAGSAASTAAQLTVAVAANVQFAMEEIRPLFQRETGIEIQAVYGASGKLATQIRSGAPFDVLVSADMDFPDSVHAWGYAPEKAEPYAYGKLVLWTLKDIDLDRGLAVLGDSTVRRIALADPKRAPYGREGKKALERSRIYRSVASKLVFGENISQVTQFVVTGHADAGINAKSVVLADEMKGKGRWVEIDSTFYDRIAQGALVCKYGFDSHPTESRRFLQFLHSPGARAVLARYGYVLP